MIFQGSRYTKSNVYEPNRAGKLIFEQRQKVLFEASNMTYYTVIEGDTIDGIAYRQYGNAQLYWAILDANPLYLSECEIVPGDVLAIPPYDLVVNYLG